MKHGFFFDNEKNFRRISATHVQCIRCEQNGTVYTLTHKKGDSTHSMSYHLCNTHSTSNKTFNQTSELQKSVTKLVVHHSLPFNLFECTCFENVIQKARQFPEEALPKAENIGVNVFLEFEKQIKEIRENLQLASNVSLVIDHWTSVDTVNYLGIIVIFS